MTFLLLQMEQASVPGDSIQSGSTVPADEQSSQSFGGVSSLTGDNTPAGVIGEVIFYIFVFKTQQDAQAVIEGVNGIGLGLNNHSTKSFSKI